MPETIECDICKHTATKEGSILVEFEETDYNVCEYCIDDMVKYVILELRAENVHKRIQHNWNS